MQFEASSIEEIKVFVTVDVVDIFEDVFHRF